MAVRPRQDALPLSAPPPLSAHEAELKLKSLLHGFPRSEARRIKARAFWRARKAKKAALRTETKVRQTDEAVCPITLLTLADMSQPCIASDGCIYESSALARWASVNPTSPTTRADLRYGVPLQLARRALAEPRSLSEPS